MSCSRVLTPLFSAPCFAKWLPVTLTALLLALAMDVSAGNRYITLSDYLQRNPEQKALMAKLQAKVNAPAVALTKPGGKLVRIAMAVPGLQLSDFWLRTATALRRRLDRIGVVYQLDSHLFSLESDNFSQDARFDAALKDDPDYLLLTLDSHLQQRSIERLLAQSRPKLILLNITTPIQQWGRNQPFLYAGFDHQEGSQLLADAMLADKGNQPRTVSLLYRSPGYVSDMRGNILVERLQQEGVRLSSRFYTDSTRGSSRAAALTALQQDPGIDFIFACSTDVAFGAVDAIAELGLQGKVRVNGWGGGQSEIDAIRRGSLDMTVMRINDDAGIAIAEAIRSDLAGEPVPQVFAGRFHLITQATDALTLKTLEKRAFRLSSEWEQE